MSEPQLRLVSVADARHEMACADTQLTDAEKMRVSRFVRNDDRERFILGRMTLRTMLSEKFDIRPSEAVFEATPLGKLHLPKHPEIGFSIAHSGGYVLVGVGKGMDIGVDVEMHRAIAFDGVGRLVFSASENGAVSNVPPTARARLFYRHWTLKEALVKALGTGLSREPRRFAVDPLSSPPSLTFLGAGSDDIGTGWALSDVPVANDYSAALAWRRRA